MVFVSLNVSILHNSNDNESFNGYDFRLCPGHKDILTLQALMNKSDVMDKEDDANEDLENEEGDDDDDDASFHEASEIDLVDDEDDDEYEERDDDAFFSNLHELEFTSLIV